MKKKTTGAAPLTPQEYIRQRGRSLPIDRCLRIADDSGMENIIVVRRHPKGTFSYACYLIDRWCTGLRDSLWGFNADAKDTDDFCLRMQGSLTAQEISYTEAHNRIYGAIAFAEDAGIEPGKGWKFSQYLLEEDSDEIELIEYEFGDNGRYHLVADTWDEARPYMNILDKSLGRGNYLLTINGEEVK